MGILNIQEVSQPSGFDASNDNLLSDKSGFGYSLLKYPLDLGSPQKGHYVVFFINQQDKSQYKSATTSEKPTVIQNQIDAGTSNFLESALNPANATQRTAGAVALYMPDTLAFDNSQSFSDIDLAGTAANLAGGLKSILPETTKFGNTKEVGGTVKNGGSAVQAAAGLAGPAAAQAYQTAVGALGNIAKAGAQAIFGVAINPMLELIYSSPSFRTYRFDFMFYPKSSKESEAVQKIIDLFRFHFSPETLKSSSGFFLVPPSNFDIKFYYNGTENPNIEKTTTCVMTSLSCDYAPNGWAAYEIPGQTQPTLGGTGSPVAIRLTMQFKEVEYKTKEHYKAAQNSFASDPYGGGDTFKLDGLPGADPQSTPSTPYDDYLNQVGFQG